MVLGAVLGLAAFWPAAPAAPPAQILYSLVTLLQWDPPDARWQVVVVAGDWNGSTVHRFDFAAQLNPSGPSNLDAEVRATVAECLTDVNRGLGFVHAWPQAAAAGCAWAQGELWQWRDVFPLVRSNFRRRT